MPRKSSQGTERLIVLTTVGSEEQAVRIAEELVEGKLAACVNIQPGIRSIYRWKDKLWDDEELLLIIKTTASAFEQVRNRIRELHSYELPEILALSVAQGDAEALEWIGRSVDPDGARAAGAE